MSKIPFAGADKIVGNAPAKLKQSTKTTKELQPVAVPMPDGSYLAAATLFSLLDLPFGGETQRKSVVPKLQQYLQLQSASAETQAPPQLAKFFARWERRFRNLQIAGEMCAVALSYGARPRRAHPNVGELAAILEKRACVSNVKARMWRPSRPVLALAAALWFAINFEKALRDGILQRGDNHTVAELLPFFVRASLPVRETADETKRIPLADLFCNPAFIVGWVQLTQAFRIELGACSLRIPAAEMIDIRFVEDSSSPI